MARANRVAVTGYQDRLTPFNAVVVSFAGWLFVFILAPVDPRWGDDMSGYMLVLLGVAGLLLGARLPEAVGVEARDVFISENACLNALKICTLLGFIGLACKVFDSIILRGVDFSQDALVAREQMGRSETNGFAVAAAALVPFGNAALLMGWYAKRIGLVKHIKRSAWIIGAAPGVMSMLLASRSALLIFGCLIFAAWINLAPRIRLRHVVGFVLIAFGATSLFAIVFVNRVEMSGMTMLMAARYSAYTQVVPLQLWAMSIIDGAGTLGPLLAGYASMLQYFTSGLFEFIYLVDLKSDNFGGGSYTFFFVPKFLALVTSGAYDARLTDMGNDLLNPRSGVFQSFFGPLYLDFGVYVPLFCVIFGAIAGFLRCAVLRGNLFAFPLYAFMLMQLLTASSLPSLSMNAAILSNISLAFVYFIGGRILQRSDKPVRAEAVSL